MKRFFRGTDKQLAQIPEQVEPTGDNRQHVRKSIRKQLREMVQGGEIDADEFEPGSLEEMKHGRAARCPKGQEIGEMLQNKKYHIHHRKPRYKGGTNKKENLVIVTPLYHDEGIMDPEHHYNGRPSKRKK